MSSIRDFLKLLARGVIDDDLWGYSSALTYRLLLALFPFLIFLMSLVGFFNLGDAIDSVNLSVSFPPEVSGIIDAFVSEVLVGRNLSLLSVSLFVAVFSASSGFRAIIKGINKSYNTTDTRNPVVIGIVAVGLVFLFSVSIIICLVVLIFGEHLIALADRYYDIPEYAFMLYAALRYVGVMAALLAVLCAIYKFSSCKKVSFLSVVPGSIVTVSLWVLASRLFEIYIANFSRFSVIYGSLGSVFIMMLWLNLISFLLLVGSEINALLGESGS
jgi:membrane protein